MAKEFTITLDVNLNTDPNDPGNVSDVTDAMGGHGKTEKDIPFSGIFKGRKIVGMEQILLIRTNPGYCVWQGGVLRCF